MKKPAFIRFYYERINLSLDIHLLAQYMEEKTGLSVDVEGDIISSDCNLKLLAEEFSHAKVTNVVREELNIQPLPAEIEYEWRLLSSQKHSGLLYDGFYLQEIFRRLLPLLEHTLVHIHIIFTSRLFGTFADNRYHARVALFGHPTLISTTGIVEAPAKPREFYLKKQAGQDMAIIKEEFRGRFIDYDDLRMTEIMKGYVMQAFFYQALGNPFCDDPNCRLYNAHWQEEVIQAQLSLPEFCQLHQQILARLRVEEGKYSL